MRKPLRTDDHTRLRTLLRATRQQSGLTQVAVAARLGTPQSFVAKYEGGERRLDVLEFVAVVRALEADPVGILRALIGGVEPESDVGGDLAAPNERKNTASGKPLRLRGRRAS